MKKILLTSAIIFGAVVASFAQDTPPPTASATLNVNLGSVKTIEVLTPTVNINVSNAADYVAAGSGTGVFKEEVGHLKVVSTGAFKVTASSTTHLIGATKASESIDKNNIYLLAYGNDTPVGATFLGLATPTEKSLGAVNNPLIETTGGTSGTFFDVKYTLRGQTDIANLSSQAYTTTVVYTLEDK